MFGPFSVLIPSLIHLYVFWRISSIPIVKQHIPIKYILFMALILFATLFLGFGVGRNQIGIFASILQIISVSWMGVLLLTFISFLAADIFTGFGFFFPKYASSVRGWALVVGVFLSLIGFVQANRAPVVDKYEVYLSGLPKELDGIVIMAIGDTHVGLQISDQWLASRVAQINEQKPDIVLLLGDMIDRHDSEREDAIAVTLADLKAPLGVWAVLGNHEFFGRGDDGLTSIFHKAHIPVLRGAWKELKPGLILAGVDFPRRSMGDRRAATPDSITPALAGRPKGATIFLSHFPFGEEIAAKAGVDLMLCAHTHGGQIWPMNYIVQATYHLVAGEYIINGMPVIVTRGAGTWGPRMRLWKRGQILRITLRAKSTHNK
jgi:uncharacterized protein